MEPTYIPSYTSTPGITRLMQEVTWLQRVEARSEAFMSDVVRSYTYGAGRGERTYTSGPFEAGVDEVMGRLNLDLAQLGYGSMNVCFLNRYDGRNQQLGWHADDHPGTDHTRPIVVLSFGQAREIWWRTNGQTGEVPASQRRLLEDGSMFIMPPGFQSTHQHRIPKGDREMACRVSLTFRAFLT